MGSMESVNVGVFYKRRNITLDLLSVRRTGIMRVYLFCLSALIERHEPVQKVITGSVVVVAASVIWEVIAEGRSG
jgi:hypothetical protein